MKWGLATTIWVTCAATVSLAQEPTPPRKLPDSLPSLVSPPTPSPDQLRQQRETALKGLKEQLVNFDAGSVAYIQIDGRWQLRSGSVMLKDFGSDRAAAIEAARLLRELRPNQLGTIAGSQPPFEYWLQDGKAPRGINARLDIIPLTARTIRAEKVGGTWVVTDGNKALYDFGKDDTACKQAALVFEKYGFNQLGIVGSPKPSMFVPLLDPRQAIVEKKSPLPEPTPLAVMTEAGRTSLLLPGDVHAGSRKPFDVKSLEVVRDQGVWTLRHDGQVLGTFNASEANARGAMKCLKDLQPTEICRVGKANVPVFLRDGLALRGEPLGVMKASWRPERLKVQKVRDAYWLFDENRPLMEVGSQADAEIYLQVIKSYELRCALQYGRLDTGGFWVLTHGR